MGKFVENRQNAKKIPDQLWEKHKPIIIEMYVNMKLSEVKEFMANKHNFRATTRQYVHQFQKWKLKKYKKRGKNPKDTATSSSTVESLHARELPSLHSRLLRYRCLAEMLLALGGAHYSFDIHLALYKYDRSTANMIDCVRTARTEEQASAARDLLDEGTEDDDQNEDSWDAFIFDLNLAHTYGVDTNNGIGQIEQAILDRVDDEEGWARLKRLDPRGPRLDVPGYFILSSSLERYNQSTDHEKGEEDIDAPGVLRQFLNQQPAFGGGLGHMQTDPLLEIDCLPSCLKWCISVLESGRVIPLDIHGAVVDELTEVYAVRCTLWHVWLGFHFPSSASDTAAHHLPSPAWTDNAKLQLDISATQLLATVASMMMTEALQQETAIGRPSLIRALAGGRALECLSSEDLIDRFLKQVLSTNLPSPAEAADLAGPFHEFVAKSLWIDDLAALERGAAISLTLDEPIPLLHAQYGER